MEEIKSIAVIGNYLPRKCGIATFTKDVVTSIQKSKSEIDCWAIAMNDTEQGYDYPPTVRYAINQNNINDYFDVANFLNISNVDVVSLQHEYGIFGGTAGNFIVKLIGNIRQPVITTLHTVLEFPNDDQRNVLNDIIAISHKLIVMSHKAKDLLQKVHQVSDEKIEIIYHGIPDISFVDTSFYKDIFKLEDHTILLTFGLLHANKGIEYVIQALPKIIERHPDVIYLILGETHPHVKKHEGEAYRIMLKNMAQALGVENHIKFFNSFVETKRLLDFIGASDIYITPYLSENQITSGPLSYALGAGKAVVSTPYWHAQEFLDDGKGILVDFRNSEQISDAVNSLLEDNTLRNNMRKKAYMFLRKSIWEQVSLDYVSVFSKSIYERFSKVRTKYTKDIFTIDSDFELLDINFKHLLLLTDDTSILQHATFDIPEFDHGYCVDDASRALIISVIGAHLLQKEDVLLNLEKKYLAFIKHAYNEKFGTFRNFMSFNRVWIDQKGSEDSLGRVIWALCVCSAFSKNEGSVGLSTRLIHQSLEKVKNLKHHRAISFALIGLNVFVAKYSGNLEVKTIRDNLANKLFTLFQTYIMDEWIWADDHLSYANAKIPQALMLSGKWMQRNDMIEMGLKILDWLLKLQKGNLHLSFVGNNGWFKRDAEMPRFDQQPIEAQSTLEASLLAYKLTQHEVYLEAARLCYHWFLGMNDLREPLYDYATGGCRDGLTPNGPNLNQGAESTLAWLKSLILMHSFKAGNDRLQYI